MSELSSRFYVDDGDLDRMLSLVSASTRNDGLAAGHFHCGDVVWGLFQNLTIDPTTRLRLFEDGTGALRGFVWLHPPRGFGIHLDTTFPNLESTIAEMVRWAEAHLRAIVPEDTSLTMFEVDEVPSTFEPLRNTLTSLGYDPTGNVDFLLNRRSLRDAIEEPNLPDDAVVRPVDLMNVSEVEARVALHQEVWESSRFSLDGYARLRTKPGYRPDLDLVAVAPDGTLASYCIAWWDPDTRTAEFEPVGTSARVRRRGYGKGLLLEAMRRLQALGVEDALVISSTLQEFEPSRFLYASIGFNEITRFETWKRPV